MGKNVSNPEIICVINHFEYAITKRADFRRNTCRHEKTNLINKFLSFKIINILSLTAFIDTIVLYLLSLSVVYSVPIIQSSSVFLWSPLMCFSLRIEISVAN